MGFTVFLLAFWVFDLCVYLFAPDPDDYYPEIPDDSGLFQSERSEIDADELDAIMRTRRISEKLERKKINRELVLEITNES